MWVFCFACLPRPTLSFRLVAFLCCACTCVHQPAVVFSSSYSSPWGSPSSGVASSVAPDPPRLLGTGLEDFPTATSARGFSYRLNPCEGRTAAERFGWALSSTIPTQAQGAPLSGAAFFMSLSPPRGFRHRADGFPIQPLPRVLDTAARTPAKIANPQPLPRVLDRRLNPCNEGRSAENPGWSLFGSILGRTPRRVSAARAPRFVFRK